MSVEEHLTELRERTDELLREAPLTPGPKVTQGVLDLVTLALAAAQAAAASEAASSPDAEATQLTGEEHFTRVIRERWVAPPLDDRGERARFSAWISSDLSESDWASDDWTPDAPYWTAALNWLELRRLFHKRQGVILEAWTAGSGVVHMRTPARLRIVDGSKEIVREAGDLLCETPSNRRKKREGFKRTDTHLPLCHPCSRVAHSVVPESTWYELQSRVPAMTAPGWRWEGDA